MDWYAVAPMWVADAQVKWERGQTIRRMAECGLSHADIAARIGVINEGGVASLLGRKKIGPPPVMEWANAAAAARMVARSGPMQDKGLAHPDLSKFTLPQLEKEVRLRKRLREPPLVSW